MSKRMTRLAAVGLFCALSAAACGPEPMVAVQGRAATSPEFPCGPGCPDMAIDEPSELLKVYGPGQWSQATLATAHLEYWANGTLDEKFPLGNALAEQQGSPVAYVADPPRSKTIPDLAGVWLTFEDGQIQLPVTVSSQD